MHSEAKNGMVELGLTELRLVQMSFGHRGLLEMLKEKLSLVRECKDIMLYVVINHDNAKSPPPPKDIKDL